MQETLCGAVLLVLATSRMHPAQWMSRGGGQADPAKLCAYNFSQWMRVLCCRNAAITLGTTASCHRQPTPHQRYYTSKRDASAS